MKQTLNKIFLVALFLFVVILIPNHKASATTYVYDVASGNIVVTSNPDKEIYDSGDTVFINLEITNNICGNTTVNSKIIMDLKADKKSLVVIQSKNISDSNIASLSKIQRAVSFGPLYGEGEYWIHSLVSFYTSQYIPSTDEYNNDTSYYLNSTDDFTFDFPLTVKNKPVPVVTVRKSSANIITYGTSDTITWQSTYATSCACTMSKKGVVSACVDENNTPVGSGPDGTFKTKRLTSDATFSVTCTN